jgi:hypothetical protein
LLRRNSRTMTQEHKKAWVGLYEDQRCADRQFMSSTVDTELMGHMLSNHQS